MKNKNVAVVGLWHLGCVYATSLAKLGFNVFGFDIDKNLIKNLNKGITPIFEPDLDELLKKHINKNLIFSTEEKILRDKDYIFITYDVEVDNKDTSDMSIIKKLFKIVAANVSSRTVIVISSQIPVGTSRTLINVLKKKGVKGIILGCTELPLVFPSEYSVSIYNSVDILSRALLRNYYS